MVDNPWAAWLREQEGAQVLPGGGAAADDEDGPRDEFRGGPFGWDLGPEPGRPRRRLLLVAAALWVLVLVVALAALARPGSDTGVAAVPSSLPSVDAGAGGDAAGTAGAEDAGTRTAATAGADTAGTTLPGPEGLGADGSAAATALGAVPLGASGDEVIGPGEPLAATSTRGGGEVGALLVRAALSAPSGTGGRLARYVDATVVTAVQPAGEAQVVSVLAHVLSGDGQGWQAAAVERYAVAVGRDPDGSYRAIAGPWALAPPAVPDAPPPTLEADPERLALATRALEHAGYRDIADLSLQREAAHPGVLAARARAVGPGASEPADWTLWLSDADVPTVLGSD